MFLEDTIFHNFRRVNGCQHYYCVLRGVVFRRSFYLGRASIEHCVLAVLQKSNKRNENRYFDYYIDVAEESDAVGRKVNAEMGFISFC